MTWLAQWKIYTEDCSHETNTAKTIHILVVRHSFFDRVDRLYIQCGSDVIEALLDGGCRIRRSCSGKHSLSLMILPRRLSLTASEESFKPWN
jgi:hypothetical protein